MHCYLYHLSSTRLSIRLCSSGLLWSLIKPLCQFMQLFKWFVLTTKTADKLVGFGSTSTARIHRFPVIAYIVCYVSQIAVCHSIPTNITFTSTYIFVRLFDHIDIYVTQYIYIYYIQINMLHVWLATKHHRCVDPKILSCCIVDTF